MTGFQSPPQAPKNICNIQSILTVSKCVFDDLDTFWEEKHNFTFVFLLITFFSEDFLLNYFFFADPHPPTPLDSQNLGGQSNLKKSLVPHFVQKLRPMMNMSQTAWGNVPKPSIFQHSKVYTTWSSYHPLPVFYPTKRKNLR